MMQIVYEDSLVDVSDAGVSIYDKDREEYRMTVWEEDSVLHVMFCEPVVIATQEDDVIGGRYRIPRVDSRQGEWPGICQGLSDQA